MGVRGRRGERAGTGMDEDEDPVQGGKEVHPVMLPLMWERVVADPQGRGKGELRVEKLNSIFFKASMTSFHLFMASLTLNGLEVLV